MRKGTPTGIKLQQPNCRWEFFLQNLGQPTAAAAAEVVDCRLGADDRHAGDQIAHKRSFVYIGSRRSRSLGRNTQVWIHFSLVASVATVSPDYQCRRRRRRRRWTAIAPVAVQWPPSFGSSGHSGDSFLLQVSCLFGQPVGRSVVRPFACLAGETMKWRDNSSGFQWPTVAMQQTSEKSRESNLMMPMNLLLARESRLLEGARARVTEWKAIITWPPSTNSDPDRLFASGGQRLDASRRRLQLHNHKERPRRVQCSMAEVGRKESGLRRPSGSLVELQSLAGWELVSLEAVDRRANYSNTLLLFLFSPSWLRLRPTGLAALAGR